MAPVVCAVRSLSAGAGAVLLLGLVSCGSGTTPAAPTSAGAAESNPAGDIPDNQAYVPFQPDSGLFTVKVPEGWARTGSATATTFTDKLNSVTIDTQQRAQAPDAGTARTEELPAIEQTSTNVQPGDVTTVNRSAGAALLITYTADSAPDPVTGKTVTDAIERYEFWKAGTEVVLTLSGPEGADNVDPWRMITDSFGWAG